MKTFQTLKDLLQSVDGLHWDGAIFVNMGSWASSPLATPLLLLEGDDELEDLADEESHLPKEAEKRGMKQLLDVQTLQDVVSFERKRNPSASLGDMAHAIEHYRERDDFFDPQ